ncbi:1-acyl-sn-glycerol-3-phosphate acyltransferase [bacterium]|jgi:1-acyl-sn-glycerol-3-phosphate acyltransferase|nr:1-acyl-sn-glycerol-3-phosphate acyltransferase [bacterium]
MNKMPILYRIGRFILGPFFKWYYNPTIIGKENIPKEGAILIVGNHKHLYDQCLSIISTKRFIKYMAKREYFDNKKTRWFFKAVGCISVDRSVHDGKAKGEAIETLKNGGAIGLFPEGTRNKTQEFLLPFKFGAVSMAKKTDAYLVPFGITGDYIFRSKNLVIKYGKPFKVTDMELEEANNLLYETVKKLMEDTLEK